MQIHFHITGLIIKKIVQFLLENSTFRPSFFKEGSTTFCKRPRREDTKSLTLFLINIINPVIIIDAVIYKYLGISEVGLNTICNIVGKSGKYERRYFNKLAIFS